MSGFDLPSLPGFDPSQLMQLARQFGAQGPQGPRGGAVPQEPTSPTPVGIEGGGERALDRIRTQRRGDSEFGGVLADSIARVNSLQQDVGDKARAMALGENVEVHDVLLAASKSEVAFNLLLEVRNKLVDAWEKLSRSAV